MALTTTDDIADVVATALRTGRAALAVPGGTLSVSAHGSHVFVGPFRADDGRGCLDCAVAWWVDVSPHTAGGDPAPTGVDWAPAVEELVGTVVRDEEVVAGWARRIVALDRETGVVSAHRFAVHPACVRCARPWAMTAPLDLDTPQPALAGPLRTRSFDRARVREQLLDFRFGPVAHVYRDEESPLALVTAETVVPGRASREGGYGRSHTFASSETPAFLEGLERVLGGYRHPSTPVVLGSWAELPHVALDPRTLGGHEPALAARPGFEYDVFDPDASTSWVWARTTRENRLVLVPEHVAYWHERGTGARFLYESSNGCAVGGSLEEATLHGLLEIIERDAFLLAWYASARLVEIELAPNGEFADVRDLLAGRGLRLRVLDLTADTDVPVALAVITADEESVRAGRAPAMSLASGSSVDPLKAVRVAIEECMTNAVMYPKWVQMRESVSVERCRPMLADHELVRTLEDHTGLHGLWEARPLWAFLDHPAGTITQAQFTARPALPTDDVAHTLRELLARFHRLGMDPVVVDQSSTDLAGDLGVHAVKVLVPGTVPMTFGHLHRRTVGLPRLAAGVSILRGALPWSDDPSINPVPHPFP